MKELFYVKQLPRNENLPQDLLVALADPRSQSFLSITRTPEEISIVGQLEQGSTDEANWRCIRISGPMDFSKCEPVLVLADWRPVRLNELFVDERCYWGAVQLHHALEGCWSAGLCRIYMVLHRSITP